MNRITEGHLARHYQGARGARDAALLDIAQDYALYLIHEAGLFNSGLVFKGGTALRKFRAGNAGRFSTDLDFAAPSEDLAGSVLEALDGAELDSFTFTVKNIGDDGRRGDLNITTPFGSPRLGAKIELARHPLSLSADSLRPKPLPIHDRYNFSLPPTPVIRTEEAVAEKLARYRRVALARDLYDLHWFAESGALNEAVVRRLWVLKVYRDIVMDGRGTKPIDPTTVIEGRTAQDFQHEDIGHLTRTVNIDEWVKVVRARFGFLSQLDEDERRWAACNERHRYEVETTLSQFDPSLGQADT